MACGNCHQEKYWGAFLLTIEAVLFVVVGLVSVILCCLFLTGCWSDHWGNAPWTSDGGTAQTNQPPSPITPSSRIQPAAVMTNNPTAPASLAVTASTGQAFTIFIRSSNQWMQVSPDLVAWFNFSQLKADVYLAWNANPNAAGFKVYWGTASGVYSNNLDAGNQNRAIVGGLIEGTQYYFAATAYNDVGTESSYSSEVAYAVPIVPPKFNNPKP